MVRIQTSRQAAFPAESKPPESITSRRRRPKIGLALSGGGARGMAHIGVLQALHNAGIQVDCIAATSAGAIIGLFYAHGFSPNNMLTIAKREFEPNFLFNLLPGGNLLHLAWLLRSGALRSKIEKYIPRDCQFSNLTTPLLITSTDLETGEPVLHHTENVIDAVMASIALPGIARPECLGGRVLVDGGVLNNLPVDVLWNTDVDIVIAVDVGNHRCPPTAPQETPGLLATLVRTWQIYHSRSQPSDVHINLLVEPDLADYGLADLRDIENMAAAGRDAMQSLLPTREKTATRPNSGHTTWLLKLQANGELVEIADED